MQPDMPFLCALTNKQAAPCRVRTLCNQMLREACCCGQGLEEQAAARQAGPQSLEAWLRRAEQRAANDTAHDILDAIFGRHGDSVA